MTTPNPFTAAELASLRQYADPSVIEQLAKQGPGLLRRAIELETQLASLQRHFDAAAPEHNLPALLDLYLDRQQAAERRAEELEAQLAEREGLERRRDALLCTKSAYALHSATTNGLRAHHQVAFRAPGTNELLGDYLGRVGVGPDYWQALRAALGDAEKGKT